LELCFWILIQELKSLGKILPEVYIEKFKAKYKKYLDYYESQNYTIFIKYGIVSYLS